MADSVVCHLRSSEPLCLVLCLRDMKKWKHDALLVTYVQHLLAPSASAVDPKYRDSWSMGPCNVISLCIAFIHLSMSG